MVFLSMNWIVIKVNMKVGQKKRVMKTSQKNTALNSMTRVLNHKYKTCQQRS